LNERDNSENLGLDVKIILEWIFREVGSKGVNWIHLTQDRDHWRALVNIVM
jgi:hypothetical protein